MDVLKKRCLGCWKPKLVKPVLTASFRFFLVLMADHRILVSPRNMGTITHSAHLVIKPILKIQITLGRRTRMAIGRGSLKNTSILMHAGPKTKGGECSVLFLKACSDLDNLSVGVNIVLNPFLEHRRQRKPC